MPRLPTPPEHLPSAPRGARALTLWLGLAVTLLGSAAFAPALRQGFVLGDDDYNLVLNPHWRGLGAEQLRNMSDEQIGAIAVALWRSQNRDSVIGRRVRRAFWNKSGAKK